MENTRRQNRGKIAEAKSLNSGLDDKQKEQGTIMGMEQKTHFSVDKSKCTRCGKCINVCSGMVIEYGQDGYPSMKEFERYGWRGCWRCEHCLAVCPVGAISIFDKKPENSLQPPPPEMGSYMEQLIVNRRSCRRYLDQDVDPKIISRILSAMASAPTGGNSCGVEYTVIDDKERVRQIWNIAYAVPHLFIAHETLVLERSS